MRKKTNGWTDGWRNLVRIGLCCALWAGPLSAQEPSRVAGEVFAGGELEEYLRLLQVAGKGTPYPWSIRGFSPLEVHRLAPRDSLHPWAGRYGFRVREGGGPELRLHAPRAAAMFNSAFPHGGNDGPVWAGRGLTTALQAGFTARWRGVSLVVAPVLFRAENRPFELVPHFRSESEPYTDWRRPTQIDLPQGYGDAPYTRLDPGQSTLRADLEGVTLGVSTANQSWGPMVEYPIILGNNAPGFAHLFLGTARPLDVGVGKVHGRILWGRLEESGLSPAHPDSAVRFMTGAVAVFTPRGVPGLEVGGGRFFHSPWPEGGPGAAHLARPFETFVKVDLVREEEGEILESIVANQLASLFARWAFPGSGLELYGELASEDHRHNLRDAITEPDHNSAYALGLRKVWTRGGELWALRGEVLNAEPSHLARGRRQEPFYVHANTRQGHTHRGQLLGSPAAYGGSGSTLALDRYHPGGRWTLRWRRMLRQERGEFLETGEAERLDVLQGLGAEALLFRGRWEATARVEGVYNFNRNFESDAFNLGAALEVRARL